MFEDPDVNHVTCGQSEQNERGVFDESRRFDVGNRRYLARFHHGDPDYDGHRQTRQHFDRSYGRTNVSARRRPEFGSASQTVPIGRERKICRYYAQGHCYKGDRCPYVHSDEEQVVGNVPMRGHLQWTPMVKRELSLATVTQDQLAILRKVELNQLKKRFPSANEEQTKDGSSFRIAFEPTDPDWPFDVKVVHLDVTFPADYPKVVPLVMITETGNDALPLILTKHLTRCVQTWFESLHTLNTASDKIELTFRPFLRWFDRQLEEMFTTGLKMAKRDLEAEAAGIVFVPFNHLPGSQAEPSDISAQPSADIGSDLYPKLGDLSLNNVNEHQDNLCKKPSTSTQTSKRSQCDPVVKVERPETKFSDSCSIGIGGKSPNKGTEIMLRNLQLGENVASIICHKVCVTIQCSRCKAQSDILADAKKCNVIPCPKCHNRQQMSFRPSLLHSFSSVLGYLDLDGCQAFDLPIFDCHLAVDCLGCNKQIRTDGMHYGQQWTSWCHACNAKLTVYIDSAKFRMLQPNKFGEKRLVQLIKLGKKDKRVHDPAIQEGRPLPSNGTCRHFKKSYRWFRFPCCGKAYPCDLCHNEKELEHEMKFATRVICGFCAKEQPYTSNRPCVVCESNFNHVGKGHWEGGKGCRDKGRMNRADSQKYAGVSKTVSRKSTELKEKGVRKSKRQRIRVDQSA